MGQSTCPPRRSNGGMWKGKKETIMSLYRKATLGLALAVSMTALATGANAQGYTGQFATFTKALGLGASILSFDGVGTLAFTPNPMVGTRAEFDDSISSSLDPGAKLSFGPLTGGVMGSDVYHWSFSGAFSFMIEDAFGGDLLSGTFTGATLDTSGGLSGNLLSFNGVTYSSGLYLTTIQTDFPDTSNLGDFAFSLSGINHGVGAGNLGADPGTGAFELGGNGVRSGLTGNFNITANVPEPGEWAAMGVLSLGLGGLVVRARRKRA